MRRRLWNAYQWGCRLANPEEIVSAARAAGVVGARSGIPTHIKLEARAETIIANACAGEPLVVRDQYLLARHAAEVVDGLALAVAATGAQRGILALINNDLDIDAAVRAAVEGRPRVDIFSAPNFYPVGDEFTLTYEATGRVPGAGGAASVGVLLFSIETLYDLARAMRGIPVTHRTVSITGCVRDPKVMRLPLGSSIGDAVEQAGGAEGRFRVLLGGPVTGSLVEDLSQPITKLTEGLVVLPEKHIQVQKRVRSLATMLLRARSACFQCRDCTDHCTRHLMGRGIEPHNIMRAICYSLDNLNDSITSAVDCGECGVCDSFVCRMGISPRLVCKQIKSHLRMMGWQPPEDDRPPRISPDHGRGRIEFGALCRRLGITEYIENTAWHTIIHADAQEATFAHLHVPLLQHSGTPAQAVVAENENVRPGQLIGEIPDGAQCARVHAPAAGVVKAIGRSVSIVNTRPAPGDSANRDMDDTDIVQSVP